MSTSYWEVAIQGHHLDLAYLARHFKAPPVAVVKRDDADGYVLRMDKFATCTNDGEVLDLAQRQLVRLTGVMKHERGGAEPVQAGAVFRRHPNGRQDAFFHVHDTWTIRMDVETSVTDSDGRAGQQLMVPSRAARLSALCDRDTAVETVMRLMAAPDAKTWVGLYRRYEVIESDVGGQRALESRAWSAAGDVGRFKHCANSVTVAGDGARHGKEPTAPPADPMSLEEADAFVRGLTEKWLASKGV